MKTLNKAFKSALWIEATAILFMILVQMLADLKAVDSAWYAARADELFGLTFTIVLIFSIALLLTLLIWLLIYLFRNKFINDERLEDKVYGLQETIISRLERWINES